MLSHSAGKNKGICGCSYETIVMIMDGKIAEKMVLFIENDIGMHYSQTIESVQEAVLGARYTVVDTKLGIVVLGGSEKGLRFLTLPQPSIRTALACAGDYINEAVEERYAFGDLPLRLRRYFKGEVVSFPDKLDLEGATAFLQAVWRATHSIPYGEVRSYAWIARSIGKPRACRAVGSAMARNRFPVIVPCHRVVASDGRLGGFSGGLELKKRLLELEARRANISNSPYLQQ
jgi:methylated-DNA-[protein]-cysteine S-methyltransferase